MCEKHDNNIRSWIWESADLGKCMTQLEERMKRRRENQSKARGEKTGKGREGKGRGGKGREGKGREGKGRGETDTRGGSGAAAETGTGIGRKGTGGRGAGAGGETDTREEAEAAAETETENRKEEEEAIVMPSSTGRLTRTLLLGRFMKVKLPTSSTLGALCSWKDCEGDWRVWSTFHSCAEKGV